MTKVVVLGHGGYGSAMRRNIEMLSGEQEDVYYVDFNEEDDAEPDEARVRSVNELWHERGGHDIHEIEENLRCDENGLSLPESGEHAGGENGEDVGDVGDEGYDACAGDGDIIHGQKARVEDAGDEHVVEGGQQRAAEVDHPSLRIVVPGIEDIGKTQPECLNLRFQHVRFLPPKAYFSVRGHCSILPGQVQ